MSNQTILIACITLGSLGGWYVIISKYLALKDRLKLNTPQPKPQNEVVMTHKKEPTAVQSVYMPDPYPETDYEPGEHIPGMGPAPLDNMPYRVPPEVIAALQHKQKMQEAKVEQTFAEPVEQSKQIVNHHKKRDICNMATLLHLSGLGFITGIPFVNIILPLFLWLSKKEQHPFLAKQGREVINFQITFTIIQFACLGLGTIFIWVFPGAAANLFEWTRTVRVVFATSMYLPFNMFSAIPFFWGCIMVIRGAVAAYHGINYRYPYAQPFIFEGKVLQSKPQTDPVIVRKEPELPQHETAVPKFTKINFG